MSRTFGHRPRPSRVCAVAELYVRASVCALTACTLWTGLEGGRGREGEGKVLFGPLLPFVWCSRLLQRLLATVELGLLLPGAAFFAGITIGGCAAVLAGKSLPS